MSAYDNNIPLLELLVHSHADVNAVGPEATAGKTALHQAAVNNSVDAIKFLVSRGANIEARDSKGKTVLMTACEWGQADAAMTLLALGADPRAQDSTFSYVITWAAAGGSVPIMKELLARGALLMHPEQLEASAAAMAPPAPVPASSDDQQQQDSKSSSKSSKSSSGSSTPAPKKPTFTSPLHAAINSGRPEMVQFILDYTTGADAKQHFDLDAVDSSLDSPLIAAVKKNQLDVVHLLVKRGASLRPPAPIESKTFDSAITWAAHRGSVKMINLLLELGDSIHEKRGSQTLPIHAAAFMNRCNTIKHLVKLGCDINSLSDAGWTPLIFAARGNAAAAINLLLDLGAQIHSNPSSGASGSALHWVKSAAIAKLLIDRGASVHAQDAEGETPLCYLSSRNPCKEAVVSLLERGARVGHIANVSKTTPLILAVEYNQTDILKVLLDWLKTNKKQVLDHIDADGSSALHMAITTRNLDAVNMLLRSGASVNLIEKKSGLSPFEIAASMDELDICSSLMNYGAMVSHKALQLNARTPQKMLAKFLIAGCKAQQPWEIKTENWTPAEVLASTAAERGDAELLKLTTTCKLRMLALPAALHAAATAGHVECCKILLEHGALIQKTETAEKLNSLRLHTSAVVDVSATSSTGAVAAVETGQTLLDWALSSPDRFYVGVMPSKIQDIIDGFSLMPYATCMAATIAIVHHPENKYNLSLAAADKSKMWKRLMLACSNILERFWTHPGANNHHNTTGTGKDQHKNIAEGIASVFYVRSLLFMLQGKWDGLLGEVVALLKDTQKMKIIQQASEQSKHRLNALAMFCCHQLGNSKGAKKYAAAVPTAGPPTISSLFDAQITSVWRSYHDAISVASPDGKAHSSSSALTSDILLNGSEPLNFSGTSSAPSKKSSKRSGKGGKAGAASSNAANATHSQNGSNGNSSKSSHSNSNNVAHVYQRSASEKSLPPMPAFLQARAKAPRVKSAPIILDGGIVVEELDDDELPFPPLCSVCAEESQDTALVPCGHAFCEKCAATLRKCPTCLVDVKMTLKMEFEWT
eukprot:TRINITY_DN4664_c0_g2_i2.p1 TRINITY_DN4664_c0_g2~~TRINITY_DN4664_c0_g2_i2.p1  ORF type:complete len:1094 (+),score=221.20 TRINITY_DN4664_c0_g2_i2:150-3284(+)